MLGCFSLLLKFAKMKDFRFTEFGNKNLEFCNCLCMFPNQMTMHRSGMQGFDILGDDLVLGYFWSLGFQLQKPSIEIGTSLFLVLSAQHEVFLCAELRLEPLEV
jgi:hypothetical protein